ncbi:MAG: class A beta-lactamase-related serine hydrolase [Gemmataceae bacterium]|nr:class A beta-lactamase-related serine hydrolase [Gemmataceae bacterium]
MTSRSLLALGVLVLPGFNVRSQETDKAFAGRILPLVKSHRGQVAVAVKHLDSGESFHHDADQAMPTASLIKFMVMLEVYQQVREGKLKLSDLVVLRKEDMVPGSGILTYHFSDGATFPLRDAVRLMIVYSDNTATNLVLDKIGIASTGQRMAEWGCPNTRIHAKVFKGSTTSIDPERTKKFGLGSTTARETVLLLEKLHQGKLVSPEACKEMIAHLKKCDDKSKLKRFLPEKIAVAHKTGSVSDVKTDAGILYLPGGPVAVCVLTAKNEDKRFRDDNAASVLIGKIAKEVHDHFAKKAPTK